MKIVVCDACGDKCPGVFLSEQPPAQLHGDFCPRCHRTLSAVVHDEEKKFKAAVAARLAEAKVKLKIACRECGGSGSVSDSFYDGDGDVPCDFPCTACCGTGNRDGTGSPKGTQ